MDEKQKRSHSTSKNESVGHIVKAPMTTVVDLAELEQTSVETVPKKERCTTSIIALKDLDLPSEEKDCQKGQSNKHRAVQKVASAPPVVNRTQIESESCAGGEQEVKV